MNASGRSDLVCRSAVLTAGAKAAVLSGETTLRRAELLGQVEPLENGSATTRELAGIGGKLARTLLPASVRDGLETMRSRPLVIVHDREASRVPWEVLRIGTVHPALVAGISRRYTERYPLGRALARRPHRERPDACAAGRGPDAGPAGGGRRRRSAAAAAAPAQREVRPARGSRRQPGTNPRRAGKLACTTCCISPVMRRSMRVNLTRGGCSAMARKCCVANTWPASAACPHSCSAMRAKQPACVDAHQLRTRQHDSSVCDGP